MTHRRRSWFRKAIEAGAAAGMSNLGFMYEYGRGGLPQDDAQAVNWYRKASAAGSAPGMRNLGVWRQLLFPVSDNYFSLSATITSFTNSPIPSTLDLTGAEDKALQGCNLSADPGARPGREAA